MKLGENGSINSGLFSVCVISSIRGFADLRVDSEAVETQNAFGKFENVPLLSCESPKLAPSPITLIKARFGVSSNFAPLIPGK